jgi:protein-L-isoaspartate O-methyltransferase
LGGAFYGVGYAEKGPYDAIHVGAAARTIPPALVEQLATPGRMIIPVGTYSQKLMQVDKDAEGRITQRDLFGVLVRILSFFLARHRTSWNAYYTFLFLSFALPVRATD